MPLGVNDLCDSDTRPIGEPDPKKMRRVVLSASAVVDGSGEVGGDVCAGGSDLLYRTT